jgi:hypothetical protein
MWAVSQYRNQARVLDRHADRQLWDEVAAIAHRKYEWSDGLPVEITYHQLASGEH